MTTTPTRSTETNAQWGWHLDQEHHHPMALADRLRTLRKQAGLSQGELATRIDVDPGRISRYESGRITPSADALIRLAETLNVSIDHLLIDDIPTDPSTPTPTPSATNSPPSPNSTTTTSTSSNPSSTPSAPRTDSEPSLADSADAR